MKTLIAAIVFGVVLSAQTSAPSVAGKWTMPLETPHGKMMMSFELKVDGKDAKKVTGTLTTQSGSMPVTGEFAEGRLKFSGGTDTGELIYTATFKDADTLNGILSSHVGDLKGVATRVKTK